MNFKGTIVREGFFWELMNASDKNAFNKVFDLLARHNGAEKRWVEDVLEVFAMKSGFMYCQVVQAVKSGLPEPLHRIAKHAAPKLQQEYNHTLENWFKDRVRLGEPTDKKYSPEPPLLLTISTMDSTNFRDYIRSHWSYSLTINKPRSKLAA